MCRDNSDLVGIDANNWFVAQLKPNALALARRNLERQHIRSFVPVQEVSRRSGDRVKTQRNPLFPGYIFVQFDPDTPGLHKINWTRGISRLLVNRPESPRPLPVQFMHGLLARCDENDVLNKPEDIKAGDRIRIVSGPFADFLSEVEHVTQDERLQVLLSLMGQDVRVVVPKMSAVKHRLSGTG